MVATGISKKRMRRDTMVKSSKYFLAFLLLVPTLAMGVTEDAVGLLGLPAISVTQTPEGVQQYSLSLQIIALMTFFSFLPALVLMTTCFTRIVIVFSILRQALGLQQTPSSQIILGLSLFLSIFIMSPVIERAYQSAVVPYLDKKMPAHEAIKEIQAPFREFMLSQTRMPDLRLFIKIRNTHAFDPQKEVVDEVEVDASVDLDSVPMSTLIPAFVISELKTAFQIGFMIFIPFLIIDLVVASILMAMGMMMLSPLIVSLPFKIMLFVFIDGWAMIVSTLTASFGL